jgi:hypothetical protein
MGSTSIYGTWISAAWNLDLAVFGGTISDVLRAEFKEPSLAPGQFFIAVSTGCVDESDEEA